MYGHVITKFSRMGSLPHFVTHGAPLRASRARAPLLDISVDFDLQNSSDHNSYESEFNDDFTIQNNSVSHTLKK